MERSNRLCGLFVSRFFGLAQFRFGLVRLDQNRLHRLGGSALGSDESAVAVELDRRRFDDVGVLPEARVPGVKSNAGRVVGSHAVSGDMNRRRRGQQGAVRLLLQFAVGALDVALGEGVAGGAVDADGVGGSRHAAVGHARIAGEHEHLVGGRVAGGVCPGLHALVGILAIGVGDVALLGDGVDAALGKKSGIHGFAGADAVGLAGSSS